MFNLVITVIALLCWSAIALFAFLQQRSNKQELRLTPFPAMVSWLMLWLLIVQCITHLAAVIEKM